MQVAALLGRQALPSCVGRAAGPANAPLPWSEPGNVRFGSHAALAQTYRVHGSRINEIAGDAGFTSWFGHGRKNLRSVGNESDAYEIGADCVMLPKWTFCR